MAINYKEQFRIQNAKKFEKLQSIQLDIKKQYEYEFEKFTPQQQDKYRDKDEVTLQFMHLYNLPFLNKDGKRMKDFEGMLYVAGWSFDQIENVKFNASLKSNWNKTSYIKERVESTGKKPHDMKIGRR